MANTTVSQEQSSSVWQGGERPFKASYGKLMMWFFLMSDAFTFSTLLLVYGLLRFQADKPWADPETVFTHFPIVTETFHLHPPLAFVGLMTFILIASSVTMVLGVEAGNRMDRKKVEIWMIWTIIGGLAFVSCQAYEWFNFIVGSHFGGLHLPDGSVMTLLFDLGVKQGTVLTPDILSGISASAASIATPGSHEPITGQAALDMMSGAKFVKGANLIVNEYSQNPPFADLFFFITGFHGSHVFSGVVINYIVYNNVVKGTYEKRGHYEMVEKVGLYWHFVDLVWVFVFTFFYLV